MVALVNGTINLRELANEARAEGRGPWVVHEDGSTGFVRACDLGECARRRFLASASPQAILTLLDERDALLEQITDGDTVIARLDGEVATLAAEVERLRAANTSRCREIEGLRSRVKVMQIDLDEAWERGA